ncbi:hypothetical protein A2V80_02740 [Candidatus Woesebacteria bacterium RBG_16_39_8b]|uniref:Uncharacterized protein n=1 Tax=Candidatus Woesebacteria bacterium RBG_16_39_8b TaxID=1802482 RepID=A0A1F7X9P9_9BACT|nr:MAG: hypothetical protein A2V80_02740 [Candidatus Woesebacteria bacterium RBG_16_39_8b]
MFEPTFSEARRVGVPRRPCEPRSGELTRFFEIRSNFVKNVHQKGNRERGRGSAGCAFTLRNVGRFTLSGAEVLRSQRCKGIIQIRREPPYKKNEENAKIISFLKERYSLSRV